MKFPAHKCGLFLTHNEHKDYYESVQQWLDHNGNDNSTSWESDEARERAIAADDVWNLQWYPDTPISSYSICAPTLEELLAFAEKVEKS